MLSVCTPIMYAVQAGVSCLVNATMCEDQDELEAYQLLRMSMKGDTCIALGTSCPSGLNRKITLAAQGVFVTSAIQVLRQPVASRQ